MVAAPLLLTGQRTLSHTSQDPVGGGGEYVYFMFYSAQRLAYSSGHVARVV